MVQLFKDAGPLGMINILAFALGLVVAAGTIALVVMKSKVARLAAVLSLVGALGVLAIGFAGYKIGIGHTRDVMGMVPDDQQAALLKKGTAEASANFVIALGASLLPLLAGVIAAARTRYRPALVLAAVAGVAYVATLVQVL